MALPPSACGPVKPVPRRPPGCSRRAAVAIVLGSWALAAPAQAFDLGALMRRMAQRRSGEARFTEERTVSGIEGPLYSSGTLSFAVPDRFARHTLHPVRESMEVQGRTLLLRRSGRTRQMEMDGVPEVAALLDAMRATLTGDTDTLQRHFRAELSGSESRWVLVLRPLDARLARQVSLIELVGTAGDLRSVLLQLSGGDRSLMQIEPLAAGGGTR